MNAQNIFVIWYRGFFLFKKNPIKATLLLLTEPVLTMLAFGVGIGSLIGKVQGVSYLEYYFVGRMANTALVTTYFKATNGLFNKIHIDGVYNSASIAHVGPNEMFWGELIWITCRTMYAVILSWFIFCCLGLGSWSAISIAPILLIDVVIIAALGMCLTVSIESSKSLFFSNIGIIVPLTLFSGAFFPVESLPKPLYILAIIFPQANVITLCRSLMAGRFADMEVLREIILLLSYFSVSLYFAQKLFIKKIKF